MYVAPYVAVIIIFFLWRLHFPNLRGPGGILQLNISPASYLATLGQLIGWYVSRLFIPLNILFIWDVPFAQKNLSLQSTGLCIVALVVCCLIVFGWRKERLKAFGLAVFAVGFFPLGLSAFIYSAKTGTAIIEPHWFCFSSIGFFLLVSQYILELKEKMDYRLWAVSFLAIALSLAVMTRKYNSLWKDEETYCHYWMSTNPLNETAIYNRAFAYIGRNDKGLNKELYSSCDEITLLAGTYNIIGNTGMAQKYYFLAFEKENNCAVAFYGLSVMYYDEGKYREARRTIQEAIRLEPNTPYFYTQLEKIQQKYNDEIPE